MQMVGTHTAIVTTDVLGRLRHVADMHPKPL
jgi:hypothetical protein